MLTYLVLNLVFLIIFGLPLLLVRIKFDKNWLVTLLILVVMTAVFDSLIVGLHIVAYDTSKISGIFIGKAPIEDFFYSILAALIVPGLWQLQSRNKK